MGPQDRTGGSSAQDIRQALSSSFRSSSPLAEEYWARDLANVSDDDVDVDDDAADRAHGEEGHFVYRRPSGVAYGGTRPVFNIQNPEEQGVSPMERQISRQAERSLLRDNHVLPPKHSSAKSSSFASRLYRRFFSTKVPARDEEAPSVTVEPPTETSPLLANGSGPDGPAPDSEEAIEEQWKQAVADGRIHTTWQRETKTLAQYSGPLILTFALQYSINVASIFAVGRIGKSELASVSGM